MMFNSFWATYEITRDSELSVVFPSVFFIIIIVVNAFIVAPYFDHVGRDQNCIVTAVIGRKLSQ